jgi:NAD(P)-dependent dehydrogenase (short-subunit alcohol dehydrogenase family)
MKKVVLITGTSSGLGLSIAVQAAEAGHTVYASMRDLSKASLLQEAAQKAEVAINLIELDVQSGNSVQAAVEQILAAEGRIDVLVNNAGMGFIRSLEQASEQEIKDVLDINFMGVGRVTKAVLPAMRNARSGHVINISSVGGLVGQPFNEVYCSAKFAVEGLTESMASYMTPSFGIHFTAVEPGGIHSEFVNTVLRNVQASGGLLQDEYLPVLQKYMDTSKKRQDVGVYQTSDEVAKVVIDVMHTIDPPVRVTLP